MIYYRISNNLSMHEPIAFAGDKFRIVKTCLRSFAETKPQGKIHFILDYCGREYLELVQQFFKDFTYEYSEYGNYKSCLKTYNLARENTDPYLFFIEDDYYWKPEAFTKMMEALEGGIELLSPYDHPDFYEDMTLHSPTCDVVWKGHHWRTSRANTMTFACHRKVFEDNLVIFNEFGPNDFHLWNKIPVKIWAPIPSLATHYVKNWKAKGFEI